MKVVVENGRAIEKLPFKRDPTEYIKDNQHMAMKRLQNICNKYSKEESVKTKILESFDKWQKKGHIKQYEDLNAIQISILENAEPSYHTPLDIQLKGNSLSTPIRIVLDASSKTTTGHSLNDILAVGVPNISLLIDIKLDFMMGPVAYVGDVSQFYPSISLSQESWPY